MSTIKIEKGIPIPRHEYRCRTLTLCPFEKMKVGDSFAIKDVDAGMYARLASVVTREHKRNDGNRYTMRRISEENVVRVWRIA